MRIKRTAPYTRKEPLDLQAGDRYAWVEDCSLIIVTQNFRFVVFDWEREFSISYNGLDEYTKKHCSRMYAVEPRGKFVTIYKELEGDNKSIELKYNNYPFFIDFIREAEYLDIILKEEGK